MFLLLYYNFPTYFKFFPVEIIWLYFPFIFLILNQVKTKTIILFMHFDEHIDSWKITIFYGFNLVNRSISNHFPNNYHLVAWDRLWGAYFEFLQCLLLPLLQIPTDVPCRGLVRPVEGKFGIIINLHQWEVLITT